MRDGGGAILFAGGGSGGHISPGLAIAERLSELDAAWTPFFACSERPVDVAMLQHAGVPFEPLPARPPVRRPDRLLAFAHAFAASRRRVIALSARHRVGAIVALGGFVAAPAAAAARRAGVPLVLVNLDAPPGRANRWIARRARIVVSAVPVDDPPGFADEVVGVPIRRSALSTEGAESCRRALGLEPDRPTLLVTGASQGARSLNELVLTLVQRSPGVLDGWQMLCLTGRADHVRMRDGLAESGMRARVEPFLDAMGLAWGAADLAVSRAGANSVAEAHANHVPTLFLPYPWHHDRHQARNAEPLVAVGGAECVDDHVDLDANLAGAGARLVALLGDPGRVAAMRSALEALPCPAAAERVASIVLEHAHRA